MLNDVVKTSTGKRHDLKIKAITFIYLADSMKTKEFFKTIDGDRSKLSVTFQTGKDWPPFTIGQIRPKPWRRFKWLFCSTRAHGGSTCRPASRADHLHLFPFLLRCAFCPYETKRGWSWHRGEETCASNSSLHPLQEEEGTALRSGPCGFVPGASHAKLKGKGLLFL